MPTQRITWNPVISVRRGIRFLLIICLFISQGVIAESESITVASEQFNPGSAVQGSGWAQFYDSDSNDLLFLPYVEIDGMAIYGGDIVLGSAADFRTNPGLDSGIQQSVAIRSIRSRWIDAVVPYTVDSAFSVAQADLIRAAMDHVETNTSARFVERTNQQDFVNIVKVGGCSSYIGRLSGGQPLTLGGGCANFFGVIVHELFHALGMFHEQSRSDRDNFVTINFANIDPLFVNNFEKASNPIDVEIGSYDYNSIMHYGRFAFSRNGLETISVPNNQQIGNRSGLSAGDILGMQYIYHTDLILGLTVENQVNPGALTAINLRLTNQGDGDVGNIIAKDVKLTLPLPGNSGYQGFSSSQNWQCTLRGRSIECTLAWMNRASTTDLAINLTAATNLATMQLSPRVIASNRDIRTSNNNPTASIAVNTDTDLAVTMSVLRAEVSVGEPVEVNLNFSNTGAIDTGQVNLNFSVPSALKYTGFSGMDWLCANVNTTISCQLSNLSVSAVRQLTLEFIADSVDTSADLVANVSTQVTDGNLANNMANTALMINAASTTNSGGNSSGGSSGSASAMDLFALLSLGFLGIYSRVRRLRSRVPANWLNARIASLSVVITLGACQVQSVDAAHVLYVDSKKVPCTGLVPQQCLRIRHAENEAWEYFYSDISGFKFEAGYRYKLSVQPRHLNDPPQDASSLEYELLEVLEKECIAC